MPFLVGRHRKFFPVLLYNSKTEIFYTINRKDGAYF